MILLQQVKHLLWSSETQQCRRNPFARRRRSMYTCLIHIMSRLRHTTPTTQRTTHSSHNLEYKIPPASTSLPPFPTDTHNHFSTIQISPPKPETSAYKKPTNSSNHPHQRKQESQSSTMPQCQHTWVVIKSETTLVTFNCQACSYARGMWWIYRCTRCGAQRCARCTGKP